ncbi:MAG: DoxX family protein [Cyclobacteriaceae bacterium]|nr:DoxX family protein [Cyclobacteriaceae bacterium]UYN85239.1 MAG: DoxX family protein [Cyclobacteriaceae bacterium]
MMANQKNVLMLLRIVMGLIFITHGVARLYYWSVPGFGSFLESQGLPFGFWIAMVITTGEILSGALLAFGYFVRYCVAFHAIIIGAGIFMVHLKNGWFVVGHGTNGVEYSVLILVVLAVLFGTQPHKSFK